MKVLCLRMCGFSLSILSGSLGAEGSCPSLGLCADKHGDSSSMLQKSGGAMMQRLSPLAEANRSRERHWKGAKLQGGCRSKFKNKAREQAKTNGPTLNAADIPKWVTPLVIPPVMKKAGRNHYEIAVRQIQQQILPGGQWNNPAFSAYNGGKSFDYPATTVWSFGPACDPEPDSRNLGGKKGVAPAGNSQFNYPGYTVEATHGVEVKVDWINHLVKDPWRCDWRKPPRCSGVFRISNAKRCRECKFLQHLLPVDQSLHWANPGRLRCKESGVRATDCRPKNTRELSKQYRGPVPMVVHVHGAHADPESDGYPEAWYLPAASDIPRSYSHQGRLVNKYGRGRRTNFQQGVARYTYGNDQPTATLWFHDHSLGLTRINVYAGPAAFWLIRKEDGSEMGLKSGTLPHPAPQAGQSLEATNLPPYRNHIREIPVVIQDRSFNEDGSLFYPEDRAFFEGLPPEKLQIPFLGDQVKRTDVPPVWNPEVFSDVLVSNGVSWPLMEVEPDLYRFRLLNGCNSRVLNLAVWTIDEAGSKLEEMPFYVIGSDQSLNNKVVGVQTGKIRVYPGNGTTPDWEYSPPGFEEEALLMGPAYRVDVLLDFRGMAPGSLLQIFNTGPDSPFGGFPIDEPANPDTTGQVLRFRVITNTGVGDDATPPEDLQFGQVDASSPSLDPDLASNARDLALLEVDSHKVCVDAPTADGTVKWDEKAVPKDGKCVLLKDGADAASEPFGPVAALLGINARSGPDGAMALAWSDPISLNPAEGSTETWELWDLSADAHPIHLHLVKFWVHGRQQFDPVTGDIVGPMVPPGPTERFGWKDTMLALPGWVTYIKATFDRSGLFVWHCHMLEHEDQEMMLPYCVGDLATAPGCRSAGAQGKPRSC